MAFRRIFRLIRRSRRDLDAETREEIESHVAIAAEALERRGLDHQAALHAARARFGNYDRSVRTLQRSARHRSARVERRETLRGIAQDIRFVIRQARRTPGFSAAVVVTLALGMGANAAMFGTVDRLLLRPPGGIREPHEVKRLNFTQTFSWSGLTTQEESNFADYLLLRDEAGTFAGTAAHYSAIVTLGRGEGVRRVRQTLVTASYWTLLGVRPRIGRLLSTSDDQPGAPPVAVLNHALWRTAFGGDSTVVGRSIQLGGLDRLVVGVAEPSFMGLDLERTDVWVPMSAVAPTDLGDQWNARQMTWLRIIARLRPGVSTATAEAEATALFRRGLEAQRAETGAPPRQVGGGSEAEDATARASLESIIEARAPTGFLVRTARIAVWLGGMALLVLLIATANVANLFLARAGSRQRELAVRASLGAGSGSLARLMLTETAVFALAGTLLGLGVAVWGIGLTRRLLLPDAAWTPGTIDHRVLLLSLAAMSAVAMLTAIPPMMQAARVDPVGGLKAGARGATLKRSRLRAWLIAFQAALSVVLLVGAGLFIRSLYRAVTTDLGFDARRVAVAWLEASGTTLTASRIQEIHEAVLARSRLHPEVAHAALGTAVPFRSSQSRRVRIPGRDSLPRSPDGGPYVVEVTPEYFTTMGIQLVQGRGFADSDRLGSPGVVVLSATMARSIWPNESALGKCLIVGGPSVPCTEVVGIAEDARRQRLDAMPVLQYYLPLAQRERQGYTPVLFVRAREDPRELIGLLRHEFLAMGAEVPIARIQVLQELVDPHLRPWRLGAGMFAVFGTLALVIASIGLYSVLAYEVARRRAEFGVRVALGARARDIARLVVSQGSMIAGAGIFVGLVVALAGARFVAPLLYDTSPRDPLVLGAVAMTLVGSVFLASLLPARRATRVEPGVVLREE
jgi:predicted permease